MTLKTRKPTGLVPWPLILVEGGEKSGKSWAAAILSASKRVGRTFWLDIGEGAGDEYGAIPGVRYEIVEHDGTWAQILNAIEAIRDLARQAADAGQPPVVLVIDSITAEWELLKGLADRVARQRYFDKKKRRLPADVEPTISMDLWNEVNGRHRKLMTLLMTMPGIVIMTARGKEVAALDDSGRPIERTKEYKVEGQKTLAFDASCWVRLSRDAKPIVVGSRSVHTGIRPGVDDPQELPADWSLEWLIFDALRCDPGTAHVRDLKPLSTDDDSIGREDDDPAASRPEPDERQRAIALRDWALKSERTGEDLRPALAKLKSEHPDRAQMVVINETGDDEELARLLQRRIHDLGDHAAKAVEQSPPAANDDVDPGAAEASPPPPPADPLPAMVTDEQHRHMHALWREVGFSGDENRDNRLLVINRVLGRAEGHLLTTSKDLTLAEADQVIAALKARRDAVKRQPEGANA